MNTPTDHMPLDAAALDQLFLEARTFARNPDPWQAREVPDELLRRAWDLARMGPTASNILPMRVAFVRTPEAKARLMPLLDEGNRPKTMAAPVTAIVAMDMKFFDQLPKLNANPDARSWFAHKSEADLSIVALRNGSLQGAYLMLAARALGLDCGPMSGFDNAGVDAAFFAGTDWRSNFLINLGYGKRETLPPRGPRLGFDEACRIL
jgi:3-hydroxypropanoate dehydrogenase